MHFTSTQRAFLLRERFLSTLLVIVDLADLTDIGRLTVLGPLVGDLAANSLQLNIQNLTRISYQ